jgi:hypothetical protein
LLAWAAAWGLLWLVWRVLGQGPPLAMLVATGLAFALSLRQGTRWRRVFIAAGFPLSLAASGLLADVPAWAWLLPLALLLVLYPIHAWRDAPLFPTPGGALRGLAQLAPVAEGARIVDAGCGLGDGLRELRAEYPHAALFGLEWSWPLRLACAWRMRFATVRRADIWRADWSGYAMVYLFQRPESMPRAAAKAERELQPGAWLASLEFEVPTLAPQQVHACPDGRRVWLYRAPFERR